MRWTLQGDAATHFGLRPRWDYYAMPTSPDGLMLQFWILRRHGSRTLKISPQAIPFPAVGSPGCALLSDPSLCIPLAAGKVIRCRIRQFSPTCRRGLPFGPRLGHSRGYGQFTERYSAFILICRITTPGPFAHLAESFHTPTGNRFSLP